MAFGRLGDLVRLLRAGWVLSRYDALVPREYADQVPVPVRIFGRLSRIGVRRRGRRPGQRLAEALAGQGPAYVKFGQLLATRPDIVGLQVADDLSELQDRLPPFPTAKARDVFRASTGFAVEDVFSDFSDAIAAASVAQVHRAHLADGRQVAVKILRPGIEREARRDFAAFRLGAQLVRTFVPAARRMEPVAFIDTMERAAEQELDLRLEAGAASELKENLEQEAAIYIPAITWEYTSRRVLTLEWIEGIPIEDAAALHARGVDRPHLARELMRSFLISALHHGFFHADLHQGNMFVDRLGRLVLIDFGIMGRLDARSRKVFAEILYGFIRRDYYAASKAHFDAGYVSDRYTVEGFATALRSVGEPIFGRDAASVDMSRVLQQLFDVTEAFDMHLRPELILLQRTMVVVEGVARIIDPNINLWETAEPVVRTYVKDRVGARAVLDQAKVNLVAMRELFDTFPEFTRAAESAAAQFRDGGIALSDDTIERLARALRGKPVRDTDEGNGI